MMVPGDVRRAVSMTIAILSLAASGPLAQSGEDRTATRRTLPRPRLRDRVLSIDRCIQLALTYNRDVIKAREEITRIGGERIINRSRFLPQVSYYGRHERTEEEIEGDDRSSRDNEQVITVTQRLFELGKDTEDDISLREDEREALYALEDAIRDAMFDARVRFYRVLLKQKQIAARQDLLKEFRQKHERMKARYEKKMVLEVDVLTARLDMLNEELQINNLRSEANVLRMELLRVIGSPIGAHQVRLVGNLEDFEPLVADCVRRGLRNSTNVALAEERVNEQRRLLGKLIWEFSPDFSARFGVQAEGNTAEITLEQEEDYVWAGNLQLQRFLIIPTDGIPTFDDRITAKRGWFVTAEMTVPLFEGFRRRGRYQVERAKLRSRVTDVEIERESVELEIRTAFQTLMQRQRTVEIQEERARISRERWQIKEKLKAIGRVTDDEIETFRDRFFSNQAQLFEAQDRLVQAQENLRRAMRHFR